MQHLSFKRAWELELFTLERRRLQGDLAVAFQLQKAAYKKTGEEFSHRHVEEGQGETTLNWKSVGLV